METEIQQLEEEVEKLSQELELDHSPELQKLVEENFKARYRIMHLQKSISEQLALSTERMISPQASLGSLLQEAALSAHPSLAGRQFRMQVEPSAKEAFGDYQCGSAMSLSKLLKECGEPQSPRDAAAAIVAQLDASDLVAKAEVVGPGYINLFLSNDYVVSEVNKILVHGVRPPPVDRRRRVVIDYSSPNVAKQMHVGHLRSTIIGNSIARLCSFLGHSVLSVNHLGDWGTQFGMLIAHLREKFPNYSSVSPPIGDLQQFYKESKVRFDEDEEFKKRAYAAVVSLQQREPEYIRAWQLICDVSRRDFQQLYERLDVHDLVERGESFYQSMMDEVVEELKRQDLLVEDEGRLLMWAPGSEVPLTVVKSDGGYTYDTSDLAALRQRLFDEGGDWLVYVVDSGQATHLRNVFAAGQHIGWLNPKVARVDHVGFGVVLGEDRKKFKTRSGDTVRLRDLLEEGLQRARQKLKDKGRDKELTPEELAAAEEAVAVGCIKYADLSHNRTNDYVFSFDKMLDDRGNTAVYLLYAYTRISSIARNASIDEAELRRLASQLGVGQLQHPKEWKLAKQLLRLPDVIDRLQHDLLLHALCDYLYALACTFTEFYDVCYCIEKNKETGEIVSINHSRILLCEATARVMKCGLSLLGIRTVGKM